MSTTLSTSFYIKIKEVEDKEWFNKTPKELFDLKDYDYTCIDNPVFSKDIVFAVRGNHYFEENDCCDIDDAKYNDWEYCPHCGNCIKEDVFEVYATEEEADIGSDYFEEFGAKQLLRVIARQNNYTPSGGLF